MQISCSVIIPNYNGGSLLETCVKGLYRQTGVDFEIIIVDNCSDDGSPDLLDDRFGNLTVIKLNDNYGFSVAVNEGIRHARGKYIVLLNNDTEPEEDWLYHLIKCIDSDVKAFAVSSKMIRFHERLIIDDAGDELTVLGWAFKRGDGESRLKYCREEEVFSACGGASIYRRDILEEIGLLDEDFFAYLEDVDLSYRARRHGYRVLFCPEAIIYHIGSATSGSKYNSFKVRLTSRNSIYMIYKNMPLIQLMFNLPFLLVGFTIKYIYFSQKGFGYDYISGAAEGLMTLGHIRKNSFSIRDIASTIDIEVTLILNTFAYAASFIRRKFA